ncbi:unnamed protein product, partial [Linum tenue]
RTYRLQALLRRGRKQPKFRGRGSGANRGKIKRATLEANFKPRFATRRTTNQHSHH